MKEIEDSLLAGDIDLAVHSSKDMPAVLPAGLTIGAVLPRDDPARRRRAAGRAARGPSHAAGGRTPTSWAAGLPRIGTSSVRRIAQLTRLFPGARFDPVRGNLDTRLRKLDSGDYDAWCSPPPACVVWITSDRISAALPAETCVPAPGQGIIAIEIRDDDARARERGDDDQRLRRRRRR